MFRHLQIADWRERWLVGLADAGLRVVRAIPPLRASRAVAQPPGRILLLRLERVGDLLMALDAILLVRELAPQARIDLVVGSWNARLARLLPGIDHVETLDVPWMARERSGHSWPALIRQARRWRDRDYDLAINLEGDIRSHVLLALSGAPRRVGFAQAGGGPVLTDPVAFDPSAHIAANTIRLVARALAPAGATGKMPTPGAHRLAVPEDARRRAGALLPPAAGSLLVGIQPAAGRAIKEWHPARFAEVGAALARRRGATIVLTGSAADAAAVRQFRAAFPPDLTLIELPPETDLIVLAAVLERLALFITGDTGPMHLASAVRTPVLAVFGPSLPSRYAPLAPLTRMVRIDLPCSPCNLLRHPPARCVGHIPDCLAGIETGQVLQAAGELLDQSIRQASTAEP
jgi:ADP-heptose:LPS heptosyltransferase